MKEDELYRRLLASRLNVESCIGELRLKIRKKGAAARTLRRKLQLFGNRAFNKLDLKYRLILLGVLSLPDDVQTLCLMCCEKSVKTGAAVFPPLLECEIQELPADLGAIVRGFNYLPADVRALLEALLTPLAVNE